MSSQINLLTLITSSPNKRKKEKITNSSFKRLNFDVTWLNCEPNNTETILTRKCRYCKIEGHQLKRHKDCLYNPLNTADNIDTNPDPDVKNSLNNVNIVIYSIINNNDTAHV
jgi:hypothetical protein